MRLLAFLLSLFLSINIAWAKKSTPILSMLTYYDGETGETYNWWAEKNKGALKDISHVINHWLEKDQNHHHFINPERFKITIPKNLKKTTLNRTQMIDIAKKLKAKVIVHGDVTFKQSPIVEGNIRVIFNLSAISVLNGHLLGSVVTISDVSATAIERVSYKYDNIVVQAFHDLTAEVKERAGRGRGRELDLRVVGQLTNGQARQMVRALRRRVPGIVVFYEGGVGPEVLRLRLSLKKGGIETLEKNLKGFRFGQFSSQIVTTDAGQIHLDVRRI